jgi:hypothetical protein
MSKLITAGIVIVICWIGWIIYQHWETVNAEQAMSQAEAERAKAAVAAMNPRSLPGIPERMRDGLENSLDRAQRDGAAGLREWLKTYKKFVEDPRLAWIELDYAVLVARDNPSEAKRVFHDVKDRTAPTSPVYPRIKQLEKTYD